MKLNHTLNLCYVFCLGLVLFVQPVTMNQANENEQFKNTKKTEKPVVEQSTEILHGELLFK